MNLSRPNASETSQTSNRSRDVAPSSGLCSRCIDGCRGNCEVFKASFRGREVIYPGPFGTITAGADKEYPVDYSHLNIQGYALGAEAIDEANPDKAIFPDVDTRTVYGHLDSVKMKVPVFTGALGSTTVAMNNWEHLVVGGAISGITVVCGENVCGIDPELEVENGRVVRSPEMERRVKLYHDWYDGYGDLIVQMNVEDYRLGVAEYVVNELGVKTIELKWGQGAKCIGGEIKIDSLERALELQKRGYIITPNPSLEANQMAFKGGALKEFERHSRLGFIDEEEFLREVERIRRSIGATRVTLKTGAYGMRELAMAIKWSSKARIDLLTVDGAGGGTGMSPWRMMVEWGVPTFYLQAMTYDLCRRLANRGEYVPDIAIAGGFSNEDHVFKALAMGAPYVKAVCMGRALMIPGMVGKNIAKWMEEGDLPKTVSQFGDSIEQIFVCYHTLKKQFGDRIKDIPLGAIGVYTFCDKIKTGLTQLMAGSRNFRVSTIDRADLMALTEEAAKVSGIPYVMDAYREEAERIMDA